MGCVVWHIGTNILQERAAYILKAAEISSALKILIVADVRISNLATIRMLFLLSLLLLLLFVLAGMFTNENDGMGTCVAHI
jgi:hypothetical protein